MHAAYPLFISEVTLEDEVVVLQVGLISSIAPLGMTQCEVRMLNGDTFRLKRRPDQLLAQFRIGVNLSRCYESADDEGDG